MQNTALTGAMKRALLSADWRGTGSLTRTCQCVAQDDILLLGDAAGYAEPFTGEGMAWAIQLSLAAAEIVSQSLRHRSETRGLDDSGTTDAVEAAALANWWIATHRHLVAASQRRCRAIAWLLRHPTAVRGGLSVLQCFPGLARPFIRNVFAGNVSLPRYDAGSVRLPQIAYNLIEPARAGSSGSKVDQWQS
jgi:2-polyprenyl-6-methoxyphenol hydroxylase-like FAD-dependent oxidoreductase